MNPSISNILQFLYQTSNKYLNFFSLTFKIHSIHLSVGFFNGKTSFLEIPTQQTSENLRTPGTSTGHRVAGAVKVKFYCILC